MPAAPTCARRPPAPCPPQEALCNIADTTVENLVSACLGRQLKNEVLA